jgi:SPW repeat
MWARVLNSVLGVWLMASPAVLGYGDPAQVVDRILGPIAASFAVVAMGEATRPVRHVNLLIGGLLLLAPWVLGYSGIATVNSMLAGAVMMALSRVRGRVKESFDGGWTYVWRGHSGER